MSPQLVEVHAYEDETWKGVLPVETVSELLARHIWATYVAGVLHYLSVTPWLPVGSPVRLHPEPTNDKDPNAVSVWTEDGSQAGYIPRKVAADMNPALPRHGLVLAEMRVSGGRVGMWILVSRDPVELRVTPAAEIARHRVDHSVAHSKELCLGSLAATDHSDPIEAMRLMADALNHDHEHLSVGPHALGNL
jgi:hypothetical protein